MLSHSSSPLDTCLVVEFSPLPNGKPPPSSELTLNDGTMFFVLRMLAVTSPPRLCRMVVGFGDFDYSRCKEVGVAGICAMTNPNASASAMMSVVDANHTQRRSLVEPCASLTPLSRAPEAKACSKPRRRTDNAIAGASSRGPW
jgi:hypothetical protein